MKKTKKYIWTIRLFSGLAIIFCFTLIQVFSLRFINPPVTPNLAWEWAMSFIYNKPGKSAYYWKEIEKISPYLRRSVIASEDQRFLIHNGFDLQEIEKAIQDFFIQDKKLRGASTISMQTARSVFLLYSRNVVGRKLLEAYYTILIELFWDKKRILEMYLNTVDWGTGVTGAEAAARKYFSKSAKDLTREEAALMTAILPNPHKWSVKNPSEYVKMRQANILRNMNKMPLL